MKFSLAIGGAVALGSTTPERPLYLDAEQHWSTFKTQHKRKYDSAEEEAHRFTIFSRNLHEAHLLNQKSAASTFGVTKYADWSKHEFKKLLGYKKNKDRVPPPKKNRLFKKEVADIDWREKGVAVSPVKDQGQCGSCWAFSAVEAIETGYALATGKQAILSPQQIVNCDNEDMGCNGGDPQTAYEYVEEAGGLELEEDMPYVSGDDGTGHTCEAKKNLFKVEVTDFTVIANGPTSENDMMQEIQTSPMSICVEAESWQLYTGGVVDSTTCGRNLDHCVQVVGLKAGQYWIVRNSWNTDWGESGFIRVKVGEDACGVADEATIVKAIDEPTTGDKIDDGADILIGIADGFGLTMEKPCVEDGKDISEKFLEVIKYIKEESPFAVAKAVEIITEILKSELPKTKEECKASEEELKKIADKLHIFDDPQQFLKNVLENVMANKVAIVAKFEAAALAFGEAKYHDAGADVGEALKIALEGSVNVEEPMAEIFA